MKKLIVAISFCLLLGSIFSQSISPTGNMTVVRMQHQAQPLMTGKIIAFGGITGTGTGFITHKSAELYNPTTGQWTATGSMSIPRTKFASAQLMDGKILAIGGDTNNMWYDVASCELYDPLNGTWSPTGNLTASKLGHEAVVLGDGKVLIAGGLPIGNNAQIYDPVLGTWTNTSNMNISRGLYINLVRLADGKILASGGENSNGINNAEIYNPITDTWTLVPNTMVGERYSHATIVLDNTSVLLIGSSDFTHNKTSEIYNPSNQTFTATGDMSQIRNFTPAIKLNNGNVLIYGTGDIFSPTNTQIIEVYDVASGIWSTQAYSQMGAHYYTMHKLNNGKILVAGGTELAGVTAKCYLINDLSTQAGIEEEQKIKMNIFPNPSTNMICVESPDFSIDKVHIFDASGSKVTTVLKDFDKINISSFEKGIYFLEIELNNIRVFRKFVKN